FLERAGNRLLHLRCVADVTPQRERAPTERANFCGDGFEGVGAAAACDDVRADLRQLDGDRAADALTRPCDDGDAITQRVENPTRSCRAGGLAGPPAPKG